jgi:hypothetical protein
MELITVECMNPKPHEAHTWREGFLWHRKRECGGVPRKADPFDNMLSAYCEADVRYTAALYETLFTTEEHRHHFRFAPVHSDGVIMVWRCKISGCRESYTRFRSLWNYQTRAGSKLRTDIFYRSWI